MIITNAKYGVDTEGNNISVTATIDSQELAVPMDTANRHYAEILRQVADGDLTIADAE